MDAGPLWIGSQNYPVKCRESSDSTEGRGVIDTSYAQGYTIDTKLYPISFRIRTMPLKKKVFLFKN